MLAFQTPTPWHDRTFFGMEHDPPPTKRRRLTSERNSVASTGSILPYGWVSEHVVAADNAGESSAPPAYPTLLANSYWSQPQESWSSYRTELPSASDASSNRFGHNSSTFGSDRYGSLDTQDLDWDEQFAEPHSALSTFSESVQPQYAATTVHSDRRYQSHVSRSANPASWDIMTSGPAGPQYEYLDAFQRQCQASQDNFAPYIEAPILRSSLHLGGNRTAMPPPAQPQPNPENARKILRDFDQRLENALESMDVDRLSPAADDLLAASRLLMSNARDLRLFQDKLDGSEPAPDWRHRRRNIWRDFNVTWLGLLLKQMDLSQQERSGFPIPATQSRISKTSLSMIGYEMRSLADKIKDLGLIDYEQGFNEQRITEVFEVCVNLAHELEPDPASWSERQAAELQSNSTQSFTTQGF